MVREVATCSSMEALGWRVPAAPSVGDGWCGQLARSKRVCFHAAAGSLPAAGQQPSASMLLRAAGSPPATTAAEGGLPAPTQPGCVRAAIPPRCGCSLPAPTGSVSMLPRAAFPDQPSASMLLREARPQQPSASALLRAACPHQPRCVHAAAGSFTTVCPCCCAPLSRTSRVLPCCCGQPARTNQFK